MKSIILLQLVMILFTSCDPPRVNPLSLNYVVLKANIIGNQGNTIKLGESVKLSIDVPDSLEYGYYKDGVFMNGKVKVNAINDIIPSIIGSQFDTLNGGVLGKMYGPEYKNEVFTQYSQSPYSQQTWMKPKARGVYYVELCLSSGNKIKINNDFEAQLTVVYDESINKNMDIYCRYSSPRDPNVPLPDLSNCIQGMNETQRFYCFRVE